MKRTNRQTIVHMTQHRQLKNKQHEPHQKLGVYMHYRKYVVSITEKGNRKEWVEVIRGVL